MSYQALYRAWRPQTFQDIMGQPHVTQTLTNAIARGQVAHAYLFSGPRGTGKTSAAKVLAKAVNCLQPDGVEPCNECAACRSINAGSSVDVEEIDAASNRGVDEIRQLRDKVQYAPAELQRKVYIVDEVHMLTTEAFNALLKTLEEPPAHALFVLATTEPHKIPGTIVSRCQRFDFRRIAPEVIVDRLRKVCDAEGLQYEEDALWRLAEAADGGLRDALGLLEQAVAFGQGVVTAETAAHVMGGVATADLLGLVRQLATRDVLGALQQLMAWYSAGKDAQRIVHEILQVLRDLFIVKVSRGEGQTARPGYRETAEQCSVEWLLHAVEKLGETYMNLRFVDQPRLALEAALMGLAVTVPTEAPSPPAAGQSVQEAAPASGSTHAPVVEASAVAKPATRRTTATGSAARKLEVLKQLHAAADNAFLQMVRSRWDDLLQAVKDRRIQTHAWLINGEVVLATPDTVVCAFSSPVHRNAVMKREERETIQAAFSEVFQRDVQVLALVHSDWTAFQQTLQPREEAVAAEPASAPHADVVERAKQLFPQERIEVREE
ncbi:DNA polymerase III subunit gamma/tau [Alicyclobacillus contaminans]|uniref:DNA polymerase III subunit gamma/tau n=1 Tax=Alicyclobacillus contaminans TaxID=392016 RepID=UPI000478C8E3|nr:DNA polymerase III subunit gamma/tau [Alicyclobacillus contaminans]GMA50574.1 DNA polymerase III subunit gamma/tau [Alicyclobacillus contaminans]